MENTRTYRTGSIAIPEGGERAALLDSLSQLTIDGNSSGELRDYLEADLDRFLYTLALIPESTSGTGLEIGANPYFMSVLAREYRPSLSTISIILKVLAPRYVNAWAGVAVTGKLRRSFLLLTT